MRSDQLTLEGLSVGLIQPAMDGVSQFLNSWGAEVRFCPRVDLKFSSDRQLVDFAHQVMTGEVDTVVLFTAFGLRRLDLLVTESVGRERFLNCLRDTNLVAAGLEVQKELDALGVDPSLKIESCLSWREILQTLESKIDLLNVNVSIEWTHEIHGLRAGLEARGARVTTLDFLACDQSGFEFTTPFREACYDELSVVLLTMPNQCAILRQIICNPGGQKDGQKDRQLTKLGYFDPLVGDLLHRFGWTSFRVFENNTPKSWGQQEAESIARLIGCDE